MNKGRKGGLDWEPSNVGMQADAQNVAWTALVLARQDDCTVDFKASRHAVRLHVISGLLHRLDERRCSYPVDENKADRREAVLMADANEIARHYGLRAYHQGDPRGCSLYLVEPGPEAERDYSRGHSVVRLGR